MSEGIKSWKRRARSYQQSFSNCLKDRMYDHVTSDQLVSKIGYSLYNSPSQVNEATKTAEYTKEQYDHITKVCDKIRSLQTSRDKKYYISFVYVVIRLQNNENEERLQVLFRVPKSDAGEIDIDSSMFIDLKPRVYSSWEGYLKKNKLPTCDMCYPTNGIYSETYGIVNIQFGQSCACDVSTAVLGGLDVTSKLCLLTATGLSLASLAVPIAAPLVIGAAATGIASGTYEAGRNIYHLHDIAQHGESLGLDNPDSRSAWLNLIGSVVGMATIGTTAIASGVLATESAIGRAGILLANILNSSSFGVMGIIDVGYKIFTLVMKCRDGTLKPLDILQFISACLYYYNVKIHFQLADRFISDLSCFNSDPANFLNMIRNEPYSKVKVVVHINDNSTYDALCQLLGFQSSMYRLISQLDEFNSAVSEIVPLLPTKDSGSIDKEQCKEIGSIIRQRIWKQYENDIREVLALIKHTFNTTDWREAFPDEARSNLEIPRQMCDAVDRVRAICGIGHRSDEHITLLTSARNFAAPQRSTTNEEFLDRMQFYCNCIISFYIEEREMYENELDSKISKPNFNKETFDKDYGITGDPSQHFLTKTLNKVSDPEFLGNIDKLYKNSSKTKERNPKKLAYLKSKKSSIYTFCGPKGKKKLAKNLFWNIVAGLLDLTNNSININFKSKMELVKFKNQNETGHRFRLGFRLGVCGGKKDEDKKSKLMFLIPKKGEEVVGDGIEAGIEAILIQTSFIDNCQMGTLTLIEK